MESCEQQCVGTTGSISVKQAFQKALMAEGKMKQQLNRSMCAALPHE